MKRLIIAASLSALAAWGAPSYGAEPKIPIIVKDTTSFYWQIVLAGARHAGKDLGVNVPELGAQSESDINGQISATPISTAFCTIRSMFFPFGIAWPNVIWHLSG